jgi:nicotinate dehydrogenase subunit B
LSLIADPRARRVIETAAEISGWRDRRQAGHHLGFGVARYKNSAAYLAAVAEVEVDEEVHLTRVWAAVDAGLIINPAGAASQIEGGIVQAASWSLKEQVRFEDGMVASRSWGSYPILRFSEVPAIDVQFVGAPGQAALGIGEVAQGPTAAAIANGVAHALGVRLRRLPLTRENIVAALIA